MISETSVSQKPAISTLLKGCRLRKTFLKKNAQVDALKSVDLQVDRGQIVGILGPNGAGKTTLINLILGFKKANSGTVSLFGSASHTLMSSCDMRRRLGVSMQHSVLPPLLSFAEIYKYLSTTYERPRPFKDIIEKLGLADKAHILTKDLSGGQQQRVVLGIALIGDPDLLILDEPTSQLDPQARRAVWDILLEHRSRNKSVLITTHQMEEAERLCDDIIILDKGKIQAHGSPTELIQHYCPQRIIQFKANNLDVLQELDAVQVDSRATNDGFLIRIQSQNFSDTINRLTKLEQESKVNLESMKTDRQNLEDVFLSITGRRIRS